MENNFSRRQMSHFVQIDEDGYRIAKCCGTCRHCRKHRSQEEWNETSCQAHDGKHLEFGVLGLCDKYEPGESE
jgi:ligand-binding sensor protein